MKTQADFFKSSAQKMAILSNSSLNTKYYQLPTFMSKNTFYNKNFLNSSKNKINNRYYLNNTNKIIPITKQKKQKFI